LRTALRGAGAALTGAGIVAGLVTLPERLQKALRGMSEQFGGPSQGKIESLSPDAMMARARQRQQAVIGAIEAAGISGAALGRRIEAETRLASAMNQAQARFFRATEPIWTSVLSAGASLAESVTGVGSGDVDQFRMRDRASVHSYNVLWDLVADMWRTSKWKEDNESLLTRWSNDQALNMDRMKATQLGLFPFSDEMLKPFQFQQFIDGTPDPRNPGFMMPPEMAQPADVKLR